MSDLRSDDIWKGGGSAGDQQQLYSLSQFTSTSTETLNGLWSIYYSGIARCNNVIMACTNAVNVPSAKVKQYNAEAHFLRAYYTHLLWKFWGNIPYFEKPLDAPYMGLTSQQDGFTRIDKLVGWCKEFGLHLILDMKHLGNRPSKQCLTRTSAAHHNDIRFLDFNLIPVVLLQQSFIMIVNRYGQIPLGIFLPNDILIQKSFYVFRLRQRFQIQCGSISRRFIIES